MQLQVEVRNKTFSSFEDSGQVKVLEDVKFTVDSGEFLCLFGPSGCGKTTLLNIIAGLDVHFEGSVSLQTSSGVERELRIGYVFQNPRLLPWRTVEENLKIVLSEDQIQSGIIDELLVSAELVSFRNTYPSQLSIGMQRRVSLIRAFSIKPDLLIMDEPFVSLDQRMENNLHQVLLDFWQASTPSVLFVTHQIRDAFKLATRLLVFSSSPGNIILDIPVELPYGERQNSEVFRAYVSQLINENKAILQSY